MAAFTLSWCQAFASQLAFFALAAWTLLSVPGSSGPSDGGDGCSIVKFLAGVGLVSAGLTNIGLIVWSSLCRDQKLGLNLIRFASLPTATTGLTLTLLEALILRRQHHEGDPGGQDTSMVLVCGAFAFFLSCGALMTSLYISDARVSSRESRRSGRQLGSDTDEASLREPLLTGVLNDRDSEDLEGGVGATSPPAAPTSQEGDGVSSDEDTPRWRGTRRLLQLARPQVLYLYAGCAVLLLRLPFSLSIPHFVSTTISAVQDRDFDAAVHEIMYLVVAGSIDAALDFWCVFLFGFANHRIVRGVRLELFQKLIRQEVGFFDETSSGELSSRLQSDCSEMAGDLTWFFRFSIESVVRIVGITLYMFLRNPILASCALSIAPVVALVNKLYGNWLRDNAAKVQAALASANSVALEALVNIRTVIAFSAEPYESQRYEEKIQDHYRLNIKQLYMTGVYYMTISTFLINTIVQALLLYIGSRLVQADRLTPSVLLAFMLYQGQLQSETLNLFQSYSSLIKSSGAGDKVFQLLDRRPPPPSMNSDAVQRHMHDHDTSPSGDAGIGNRPGDSPSCRQLYRVEFRAVSFTYRTRPNQPVLTDINLDLPPGRSLAIVGPSGSGKSTVCHLLQRFYDPSSGAVLVDGVDLRRLDLASYRRTLGVVNQETSLFRGTVLENIVYGCPGAIRDDAIAAARQAHIHDTILSFPDGYDTMIGDRGVQLSGTFVLENADIIGLTSRSNRSHIPFGRTPLTGGQRQRISIARAIIKRPSLLLLDEATSALDGASELAVQKALDRLLRGRSMTTVIVAHRLRTVQRADRIAVLRDGRVAELGSHSELMRIPDGLYRDMVDRAGASGFLPADSSDNNNNEGRPLEPASPAGGSGQKRTNRRSPSNAASLSPRGHVDEDIQTTIQQLEFAKRVRDDVDASRDENSGDEVAMTMLPHDGVLGRGLDSSPFAEYYLRHPPGDEPNVEISSPGNGVGNGGTTTDTPPANRSLLGRGSRDESVDSVLDATIDSLLDDEEGGGVASSP